MSHSVDDRATMGGPGPTKVKKSNDKFRVVTGSGKVVKNAGGQPVDGGGYQTGSAAESHARAINRSKG
jgi:hypothetical protein